MRIISNYQPRKLIYSYELTDDERREFDYIDRQDLGSRDFMRYRGVLYDLRDMLPTNGIDGLEAWHGICNNTFFSAVLVRDCNEFGEDGFSGDYVIAGILTA